MDLFGSILGYQSAQKANEANLKFAYDQLAQQQKNIEQQWSRQDTSVQRRAADMEAAGINPMLAAGQGAESGGMNVSAGSAGQSGYQPMGGEGIIAKIGNAADMILDARIKDAHVKEQGANIIATLANADKSISDKQWIDIKKLIDERTNRVQSQGTQGESMIGKVLNDIIAATDNQINKYQNNQPSSDWGESKKL